MKCRALRKLSAIWLLAFALGWHCGLQAQQLQWGAQAGVVLQWGTHEQQLGLQGSVFWLSQGWQVKLGTRLLWGNKYLGPPLQGLEAQCFAGLLKAWGDTLLQAPVANTEWLPPDNHSQLAYALGYTWMYYADQRQTSQATGWIFAQYRQWQLFTENDILGAPGQDRFRTASLDLRMRLDPITALGVQMRLWTGETSGLPILSHPSGKGRGYKDLSQNLHGRYSHGIVAAYLAQQVPPGMHARVALGLDTEGIRHFFQNRLIHDLAFLPYGRRLSNNPHLPKLDTEGLPYLDLEGQEVRKPRLFLGGEGSWSWVK